MMSTRQIAGFILAGGESSRMGRDKALLELDGVALVVRTARLVERVAETPTIVGAPDRLGALGFNVIGDEWPGAGPLGGIATALHASNAPWNLIVACDLPYLTKAWLEYLVVRALSSTADAVVPMNERGAEPLCAIYNRKCEPEIRAALERGTRKVTDGLDGRRVENIEPAEWKVFDSDGLLFKNMNSPADYEEAKAMFSGRARK
jgi:molybdopterin-guanine dinucleotide biosynthesis protein A